MDKNIFKQIVYEVKDKKLSVEEELKDIQIKRDILHKQLEEKDAKWDYSRRFDEYVKYIEPITSKLEKLSRRKRLITTYELAPIASFGNHMTLKEFISNVKCGGFIDYDGAGNYATATEESNITILPSDIMEKEYRKDFTHIVWYNK